MNLRKLKLGKVFALFVLFLAITVQTAFAATYTLTKSTPVYNNSYDAYDKVNVVTYYPAGSYEIFRTASNGTINISKYPGSPGAWINPSQAGSAATPPPTDTNAVVTDAVNFRKGPSKTYAIIRKLSAGTPIKVIGQTVYYYKTVHKGTTGFVSKKYVKLLGTIPAPVTPKVPRIGISWTSSGHANSADRAASAIRKAGGVPVRLNKVYDLAGAKSQLDRVDGVILTGGEDIHPSYYDEARSSRTEYVNTSRDKSDYYLTRAAINTNEPTLGICRGMQWINIISGGDLYQDIPSEFGRAVSHRDPNLSVNKYHRIKVLPYTKLRSIYGSTSILVNSWHHQGIDNVGSNLKVSARSYDNLVEGIERKDKKFIVGVQFHPESHVYNNGSPTQMKLFKALVEASK